MTVAGGTVALNMNYEGLVKRLQFFSTLFMIWQKNLILYIGYL